MPASLEPGHSAHQAASGSATLATSAYEQACIRSVRLQTALIASRCRVVREGCLADRAKEDIGQVVSVAWVRGSDCDFHRANVPPSTSAGNAAGS